MPNYRDSYRLMEDVARKIRRQYGNNCFGHGNPATIEESYCLGLWWQMVGRIIQDYDGDGIVLRKVDSKSFEMGWYDAAGEDIV